MLRLGMVAFTAIFALVGCSGDDSFGDDDAGGNSGDASIDGSFDANVIDGGPDSGCVVEYPDYPNLCCGSLAFGCGYADACGMTLDQAEDGGTGSSCVVESTNVIDNDVAIATHGTDTQTILYFDVTTRQLVGIGGFVANEGNLFCYGVVPPPTCDNEGYFPDASVCSDWNYKVVSGGCSGPGIGDAGTDADAADD